MSFSCCRPVQLTFLHSQELLLRVFVHSDGSLPLSSLSVTGLEGFVSSCAREKVSQYAPALVAAFFHVRDSPMGTSRVPPLLCGRVSEDPLPGLSFADVPVLGQSIHPGRVGVELPVSIEPVAGPPPPLKKTTVATSGKKILKSWQRLLNDVT